MFFINLYKRSVAYFCVGLQLNICIWRPFPFHKVVKSETAAAYRDLGFSTMAPNVKNVKIQMFRNAKWKKQLSTGATSLNWQFLHNGSKYKSFQLTQKYPGSALSNGWVKNLSKKFYTYALMDEENIENPVACFITSHPLASSRFPYHGQSFPLYTQFVGDRKGIKQLPSYQKLATKDFQSSPIVFHLFTILNFNNKKQVEKGRIFNQRDLVSLVLIRQRRKGREVTTQGRSSLWKWRLIWLRK